MARRGEEPQTTARPDAGTQPRPEPRTERGRRTRRALLDAAAIEFGERGFAATSIAGITARAGTALGSFYTYFDGKEAIFRALVTDLSAQVGARAGDAVAAATDALDRERAALGSFLAFTRDHRELYRIIDEAEFVDPAVWQAHYRATAARILARLRAGHAEGGLGGPPDERHAWAVMGANVFLGLRFGLWGEEGDPPDVEDTVADLLGGRLAPPADDA